MDTSTRWPPAIDLTRSFSSGQGRKEGALTAFPDPGVFKATRGFLSSSIKFQGTDGQTQTSQSKQLFVRKETS